MSQIAAPRAHRLRRMAGRDPNETHRGATPLELLYDLTFVVSFGVAADQLAHLLAEGHYRSGLIGFTVATFAISWVWINFTWFASAYDTDDWAFRLATMTQMVGVVILALRLPPMFHTIDEGRPLDNSVGVAGYVVMRVPMVFLWLRAARQDPSRRRANLTYAVTIGVAQIGWVALVPIQLSLRGFLAVGSVILLLELAGPLLAERRKGGTPWHAGHIAERFGLLTIITLGEGVIGTVASLSAVVDEQGWSRDAVLVVVAGIGLTFGIWWTYFIVPSAEILRVHRDRALLWGYLHILVFGSIAASGAGLHVAAMYIGHESHISATATVLTVAVPVLVYGLSLLAFYTYLVRAVDPLNFLLLAGMIVVIVLAVLMAGAGVPMAVCLVVLMCAPLVSIVGYETVGHRHMNAVLTTVLDLANGEIRGGSVVGTDAPARPDPAGSGTPT